MATSDEIIHASVESSGILLLTFSREIQSEDLPALRNNAVRIENLIKDLRQKEKGGVRVLIDITHFSADYVAGAVDLMVDLARHDKMFVKKTASFGGSNKARIIGETIAALAGRDNIQLFDKRADAENWLNTTDNESR